MLCEGPLTPGPLPQGARGECERGRAKPFDVQTPAGNAVKDFSAEKLGFSREREYERSQIPWTPTENTSVRKESGSCLQGRRRQAKKRAAVETSRINRANESRRLSSFSGCGTGCCRAGESWSMGIGMAIPSGSLPI